MVDVRELGGRKDRRKRNGSERGAHETDDQHSLLPAHPTKIRGYENERAERNAIPRERNEIVVADVANEPPHANKRRGERGDEADAERWQIVGDEQVAIFQELVASRGEQRRNREE